MNQPEIREDKEKYRESQAFGSKIESKILERLKAGYENFPDIINCPMPTCKNPVKVHVEKDLIRLVCGLCGWTDLIEKPSK